MDMDALLQKYQTQWSLNDPSLIAKTNTSHVYKVSYNDKIAVLKIYTESGRVHEAIGPKFLEQCHGNGVIDVYEFNNEVCLLYYVDGEELLSLVDNGKDEEATLIIAQTLNKIHKTHVPKTHPYKNLEHHMRRLFEYTQEDHSPDIVKRAAQFAKKVIQKQIEISMLHGDMHHKNVMLDSQKGWLALDPQCVVGDRAYDCANTLHNPSPPLQHDEKRLLKQTQILGAEMDIDPQRIIDYAYIHGALSSCWTKEDDGEYGQDALKTSEILEPHISEI